jgi:hypothetical protein
MHIRHLTGTLTLCILIQACSTPHAMNNLVDNGLSQAAVNSGSAGDGPETNPELDHFIAWVPRHLAQTATVAEALAQVEWGNAKEQAGARLCDGAWLVNGEVTARSGPYHATAPDRLGGYAAWYYRVSHKPGIKGCAGMTTREIYSEIRSGLPRWISIRTTGSADPFNASQQANALLTE